MRLLAKMTGVVVVDKVVIVSDTVSKFGLISEVVFNLDPTRKRCFLNQHFSSTVQYVDFLNFLTKELTKYHIFLAIGTQLKISFEIKPPLIL